MTHRLETKLTGEGSIIVHVTEAQSTEILVGFVFRSCTENRVSVSSFFCVHDKQLCGTVDVPVRSSLPLDQSINPSSFILNVSN